jgi:hypothetical protein
MSSGRRGRSRRLSCDAPYPCVGCSLIEKINSQFLFKEGAPAEYGAARAYTVAKGWLWKHESGTYVKFTAAGAEMFA